MSDFVSTDSFKKGRLHNNMHEDPTYLSFLFIFDWFSEESPLFSGEAEEYLRNIVGEPDRADKLARFIKILKKLNTEMPWFWQSVSGLETTKQYDKLSDPFRGGSDKKISIKCLESIELTVTGLIDLYKHAAYDLERWVEVLPHNLRRFKMYVYVTEVRSFKTNKKAQFIANKIDDSGFLGVNKDGNARSSSSIINSSYNGDVRSVKPFFKIALTHCTFDIDSTSAAFQDLSKSPDSVIEPTIDIKYDASHDLESYYANSIPDGKKDPTEGQLLAQGIKDAIVSSVTNKAEGAMQNVLDNSRGRLLLGNVYGVNAASTIQDAIATGSINGIANIAGQAGGSNTPPSSPDMPDNVYPDPTQIKSEPMQPKNIYDSVQNSTQRPQTSNVPRDLGNAIDRRV
jgi:hypothetical protein